jgi:hypothetical protein
MFLEAFRTHNMAARLDSHRDDAQFRACKTQKVVPVLVGIVGSFGGLAGI